MPFINVHPAPGLGEMLPGWYVVPNNPFQPRKPVAIGKGMGLMLPASTPIPQNPLIDTLKTVGMPAGQTGKVGVINGLGVIDLERYAEKLDPRSWSMNTWLIIGGALLIVLLMTRKGASRYEYKAAKAEAKAQYYSALAAAKKKHPTFIGAAYQRYQPKVFLA